MPEDLLTLSTQVMPSQRQLSWHTNELSGFIHFGLNTFLDKESSDGKEDGSVFNPSELNVVQWVTVFKEAGFKKIILTAKHHDGFCLWPSKWTEYNIAASPFLDGEGDLIKMLAEACAEQKVKLGLSVSPWDRHEETYGSDAYNVFFRNQLKELLSNYGLISEVWLDGANGEGPEGKQQNYDWNSYFELIRKLQPNTIISVSGPDVRWVGTETGFGRETEWSVIPIHNSSSLKNQLSDQNPFLAIDLNPMDQNLGGQKNLQGATHLIWYPSIVSASIRPGWFYHKNQNDQVRVSEELLDIYFNSVGRNSGLIINVPPNQKGLISNKDIDQLNSFKSAYDQIFNTNFISESAITASSANLPSELANLTDKNLTTYWEPDLHDDTPTLTATFSEERTINIIELQENIATGQKVENFKIEYWNDEEWIRLGQGTTIGYKRLIRTETITTEHLRIIFMKSRALPQISEFGVYKNLPEVTFHPKGIAFTDNVRVKLQPDDTIAQIYYTLDGTTPSAQSEQYIEPIYLNETTEIKALSILPNGVAGIANEQLYNKAKFKVLLENAPDIRYTAGGSLILTDGIFGGTQRDNNRWLGFLKDDLIAILDLQDKTTTKNITLNFLKNPSEKIHLPKEILYYGTNNLKRWTRLGRSKVRQDLNTDLFTHSITQQFKNAKYRYIKVIAKNIGVVAKNQIGEGEEAWLFIDEISIE